MAATRLGLESTYRSPSTGSVYYTFIITSDVSGNVSVRDIQGPYGLIVDTLTDVPSSVIADITTAINAVEAILAGISSTSGSVTFAAETSQAVVFSTALADATYRVYTNTAEFVPVKITSKATTGFTIEIGVTFTGTVYYDVLV